MNPEVLNFFLRVAGDYERFIGDLRAKLADHTERDNYIKQYGAWLREHPLLPKQQPIQPARWIHINLIVQGEDDLEDETRTTIAVRDDNLYLMGFKNRNGDWYEFGIEGQSEHYITESNYFLGCGPSYRDLLKGQDLSDINLRMSDAILAVRALWGHEGKANPATKRYLARLCVMICESARMTPLYETVRDGWGTNRSTISERHVRYTNTWAQMSRALMNSACNYPDNMDRQSALGVVKLILNTRRPPGALGPQGPRPQPPLGRGGPSQQGSSSSDPWTLQTPSSQPASGSGGGGTQEQQQEQTGGKSVRTRPLVQVFSAGYGYFPGIVDSIVIFDGKRGQIIYKQRPQLVDDRLSLGPRSLWEALSGQLALSGPYRAISAEGSFAVQVHGITSGTHTSKDSSKECGEMLWDCYADDVVYNKVLTHFINTGTGRPLVELTYAVLSDALEATVEVNLLLPRITRVYGDIRAQCQPLDSDLVLFGRKEDEIVELVPSAANSMISLELRRSVIAVPVRSGFSLVWMDVNLIVARPTYKVGYRGHIYIHLYKPTGEIRMDQRGELFVPVGWTGGSDPKGAGASHGSQGASSSPSRQGTEQTSMPEIKVQVNITSPGFHVSPLEPDRDWRMGWRMGVYS